MKELIYEWNPWWQGNYEFSGIKREKLKEIVPWLDRKEIISVIGVRRAGKTTLLYEIISYLINTKHTNPKSIFFIKADDDRVDAEKLIDNSIDEYRKHVNPNPEFFLFVDEIQEIREWQKTIKRIYDLNKGIKIFISGSNSSMLKKEMGSLLAGRFAYFEIFPFSFREFLSAKGIEIKDEPHVMKNRAHIRHSLSEYISNGAFPEVVLEKKESMKEEIIKFYFDSIFYRDVIKLNKIRNPAKMEKLVKYFLQNMANLVSFSKVGKLLDLTTDSVSEYVKVLEDAYLLFSMNLFEFSYKKQIINPKKIYCVDTGIRNRVGFNFSSDAGRLYENIVYVNLRRKGKEVYYWKNKNECDFIVKSGKDLGAIQVSFDLKNPSTKERELKGLLEAMAQFKIKKGIVITEDYESEEKHGAAKVNYIPLWRWLIEEI
jgi:predicted AAA+ superfamily ATPase